MQSFARLNARCDINEGAFKDKRVIILLVTVLRLATAHDLYRVGKSCYFVVVNNCLGVRE